jgi:hypothetical protein
VDGKIERDAGIEMEKETVEERTKEDMTKMGSQGQSYWLRS